MPYIKKEGRETINKTLDHTVIIHLNDGGLNYMITRICHKWIMGQGVKYFTLVRVMGCLICVMFELYRMVVGPYENKKRMLNGSVSELDAKTLEDVR